MEQLKSVRYLTLILTIVAGYCDTVTFLSADTIFSAHVTGNFVVFAYQVVHGSDVYAWVKLLTFPVFLVSVIMGGHIARIYNNKKLLILIEGLLLTVSGLMAFTLPIFIAPNMFWRYFVAMMVVFSLGLQNAFGKIFNKETLGPTTMMTGNVTQAALDLGEILRSRFRNFLGWHSLKNQLVLISGFLIGCVLGAVIGSKIGLSAVVIPGVALTLYYMTKNEA